MLTNPPPSLPVVQKQPIPIIVLYLTAILSYGFVFIFIQAEPVPLYIHTMAVILTATCFIPITIWYAHRDQSLPLFELIVLSYAIQFSVPVFTQLNQQKTIYGDIPLTWENLFQTLFIVELGIISLIIGYYLFHQLPFSKTMPRINLQLNDQQRNVYLFVGLLGGGIANLLQSLGINENLSFKAIIFLFSNQFYVAIAILAYAVYRPVSPIPQKALLFLAVFAGFLIGLMTGFLEFTFIPLALVLAIRWQITRQMPWMGLMLGAILILVLNPAKAFYRQEVWFSDRYFTAGERIAAWARATNESVNTLTGSSQIDERDELVDFTFKRFDLLHKFTWVREVTPDLVPYYRGSTYNYFIYGWIPRIIWPNKPIASASNDQTDEDYGLKLRGQPTSVGIGQLAEAYANFGIIGVVGLMFLQGLVFAALDKLLNGPESQGGRAVFLVVMIYFLNGIGSSTAILFGALIQNVVAHSMILWFFSRLGRKPKQYVYPRPRPRQPRRRALAQLDNKG